MRRVLKLSEAAQAEFLCLPKSAPRPKTIAPPTFILTRPQNFRFFQDRITHTQSSKPTSNSSFQSIVELFSHRFSCVDNKAGEDLVKAVSDLKEELVDKDGDLNKVVELLEEKGEPLFRRYRDGAAFVELLNQLDSRPQLALKVLILLLLLLFSPQFGQ